MPINLTLKQIQVHYGKAEAVSNINIEVVEGSVTSIIGANGAGKSTIMRAVSGLLPLTRGEIWLGDQRIDKIEAHKIVQLGIVQVPEGRRLFPQMSVLSNIKIGAYLRKDKAGIKKDMDKVMGRFPILDKRRNQERRP